MIHLSKMCILLLLASGIAHAQAEADSPAEDLSDSGNPSGIAPDIRDDDTKLKLQKGDFVIVPVLFSNPTLDSGLAVAAAYFHPQTEAEKEHQPASVTAAAALYSSNDSLAYGIGHQHYWNEDRWRLTGALGKGC